MPRVSEWSTDWLLPLASIWARTWSILCFARTTLMLRQSQNDEREGDGLMMMMICIMENLIFFMVFSNTQKREQKCGKRGSFKLNKPPEKKHYAQHPYFPLYLPHNKRCVGSFNWFPSSLCCLPLFQRVSHSILVDTAAWIYLPRSTIFLFASIVFCIPISNPCLLRATAMKFHKFFKLQTYARAVFLNPHDF